MRIPSPLPDHAAVLDGLDLRKNFHFEIQMVDRTGRLKTVHKGDFRTDLSAPKGRIPLLLRRTGSAPWPISAGVPFPRGTLGSELSRIDP